MLQMVCRNLLNITTDLLIDDEDKFWITTAFDGLYFYDKQSGKTIHYLYSEKAGALPTNQLTHIEQYAADSNILWISSLGAGIIKFNKTTGKCNFFTDRDGLPDNTVYAMVPDDNGIYWCSCNKGIFSFNPKNNKVLQSFTSKDGLAGDEFNRFHYFKFPNGNIAFGGVNGYTVFNPLTVQKDSYQPTVALTGIEINNAPADYGRQSSPFKTAVNSLTTSACNSTFFVFAVTLIDNVKPVITCKPAVTKTVTGSYYTVSGSEFDATATDNCGTATKAYSVSGATAISYSPANTTLSGKKLNVGTNTITCTATDFTGNSATCTTVVTVKKGNSLIAGNSSSLKTANEQNGKLEVFASPNPTSSQFTLKLQSGNKANCRIIVTDITGRKIQELNDVTANSTIQIGNSYYPGVYVAVVMQGNDKVELKLVKGGK